MENTTVYVHYYGKRYFGDKEITLHVNPVEVIETEQQYRTIDRKSSLVDRQKIDKVRTEKLIREFGRFYYISKNNDLQEFKRLILENIAERKADLQKKNHILEQEKSTIIARFEQEGVI